MSCYSVYYRIDEAAVTPAEGEKAGTNIWKKVSNSFLDFTKLGFSRTNDCAVYAFTCEFAPTDRSDCNGYPETA